MTSQGIQEPNGDLFGANNLVPFEAAQGFGDFVDDNLVLSEDPYHPVNLIPELCRLFYSLGWVTGTG